MVICCMCGTAPCARGQPCRSLTDAGAGDFTLNMDEAVTATVPLGIWPVFVQYVDAGDVEKEQVDRVRFRDTVV